MSKPTVLSPEITGSVIRGAPPVYYNPMAGNSEAPDSQLRNILGTEVDTGATCFPTVPSSFDANRHYYPGLSRSYIAAAVVESPQHSQIQYSTIDIPSVQLSMRTPLSPQVLQRWQLSQASMAAMVRP